MPPQIITAVQTVVYILFGIFGVAGFAYIMHQLFGVRRPGPDPTNQAWGEILDPFGE